MQRWRKKLKNDCIVKVGVGRIFHHKDLEPIGQSPSNAIPETISNVSHAHWYEEMSFLTSCLSLFLEPGTSDTKVIKWGPFVI